jgi:tetratricopeptide (TPR) repeat protein
MPYFIPNGGDMKFYSDWGLQIAHGIFSDHKAFYGLPGYPFLLGLLFRILNFDRFGVSILAGLIQSLADAFTAVFIWKISLETFPGTPSRPFSPAKAIGCIAALGWALYQPSQTFSAVLMPTALAVAAFWYCVWVLMRRPRAVQAQQAPFSIWLPWLPIGLLIGFSAMTVATVLFLVPLALAAIFFRFRQFRRENDAAPSNGAPRAKHPPKDGPVLWHGFEFRISNFEFPLLPAVLFLSALLAGASPCWIHNYFFAREPVLLSAHSGLNFYIGNNPLATGYPRIPPGMSAGQQGMLRDSITLAEQAEHRSLKHYEVSQYWSAKAHDYISSHRAGWLRLMARKFVNFWNAFQYDDLSLITLFNHAGILLPGPRFGWVAALAIPGMVLALFRCPRSRWIIAAVLLHMAALMPVFVTERYRLAAVPGLLLLAAYGLWQFWSFLSCLSFRSSARWLPALSYATAGLLAAFCIATPPADASLWSLDYYNTGIKALDQGDYPAARRDLETAYRYVPDNSEVNFALGLLWQSQGDLRHAETFYGRALQLNPRHSGAWSNLGVLAGKNKAWAFARNCFRRALEIDPTDAKADYLEARACAQLGQWDLARTAIQAALLLRPAQKEFQDLAARIDSRTPLPPD